MSKLLLSLFGLLTATGTGATVYSPNDPNVYYSPFAWNVTDTSAATINSASYVKFLVSGTFLNFNFDVSQMVTPVSMVYWRVDNGPMTLTLVLDTVSVVIPTNNTKGAVPYHTVELFVKSTTESKNRWRAAGDSTRVILTGLETDGELAPWIPSDVNILIYGDSITEGVRAFPGASLGTADNDASMVYSYALGRLLGTETGVIGFGYNALLHDGSGGVPPLGKAWNQLWEGVPRSFTSPKPDLIVLNEGTNDGCDTPYPGCKGTDITEAMTAVLKDLLAACPGVPIAVLEPFNGSQIKHLQAAVAASDSPDVHYIETTGFYNLTYGGALHPTGSNDVAQIAPQIAKKLRPLLAKSILNRYEK